MLRRTLPLLLIALVAPAAFAGPASALSNSPQANAAQADGLLQKTLYRTGASGRYLMDGTWYYRADATGKGAVADNAGPSTVGWKGVAVPNAWNAGDYSDASFAGGVGWYKKTFHLPSAQKALSWVVRFESVNYRSKIYLNGQLIGKNTGAYLPFEIRLPASLLKRGGDNVLAIRVDDRRFPTDFPPSGLSSIGTPTGGWWNYGGLLREVYLRKIDNIDFNTVAVLPDLPCGTCDAGVTYKTTIRNYGDKAQKVKITARLGARKVDLGTAAVGAKKFATFTKRITVKDPRLWSPDSPYLYNTSLTATAVASGKKKGRTLETYFVQTGIRSVKVVDGHLMINGKPLHARGFGVHEDTLDKGFAIDDAQREQQIQWAREEGATMFRSHYPLHPYYYERMDELGMVAWTEVPVYSVKTKYLKEQKVRKLAAKELANAVRTNINHPSIIVWSAGNELSARPGPVQGYYIQRAVKLAKSIDPTRPVGLAVAGYPSAGCQPEYAPLDVLGINEYFGWYSGPNGQIADRTTLSDYLDSVRQCYPKKAIFITETGAEANRDGPVEERGTYQFQSDFANYHYGVYATKPWLSGALWWTIEEFAVKPGWDGGNPWPMPPIHQKAPITMAGVKKPVFYDLQRIYRGTKQYGP
jgi:beta-glucuronidase